MRKGTFWTIARFAKLLRMRLRSVKEYVMEAPKMPLDRGKTLHCKAFSPSSVAGGAGVTRPGFRSS
jgi:hypothetical protein